MTTVSKVLPRDELIGRLRAARDLGRSVAMANGLFDILHVGHLRYLEAAALEADLLVVAVNSDDSARRLKGPQRPIVPDLERAELVAGFGCVDFVVVFDELTVEPLLRAVRPHVHCKGTDYSAETVPEAALARELGIRVAIVGDPKTHATREMIERVRGPASNDPPGSG
jgi:rfaE bifunctional protein nucleotidyltransferase chain/domain